tara:strand:- start:292 stop:1053 length:762 start_codon:yes stop_codon:yes gene_type:complete
MKNFIITSDRYSFLLEGYITLFNKYWVGEDIHHVILGFETPNIDLPNNFTFHSLGKQSDNPMWSQTLIPFFENVEEDYFLLSFEDHFLVKEVPIERLKEGVALIKEGGVDKLFLQNDYSDGKNGMPFSRIKEHYKGNWYSSIKGKNSIVTESLTPAIWTKDFFLKSLYNAKLQKTAGGFEGANTNLQGNILLTKDITVFPMLDACRRNRFNTDIFTRYAVEGDWSGRQDWTLDLANEDIEIFKKMEQKWNNNV